MLTIAWFIPGLRVMVSFIPKYLYLTPSEILKEDYVLYVAEKACTGSEMARRIKTLNKRKNNPMALLCGLQTSMDLYGYVFLFDYIFDYFVSYIHDMHQWRVLREFTKYSTQNVTFENSRKTLQWCISWIHAYTLVFL